MSITEQQKQELLQGKIEQCIEFLETQGYSLSVKDNQMSGNKRLVESSQYIEPLKDKVIELMAAKIAQDCNTCPVVIYKCQEKCETNVINYFLQQAFNKNSTK